MDGDNDNFSEQSDQSHSPIQTTTFKKQTIAAPPVSYPQPHPPVDQPPSALFSSIPPFSFPPAMGMFPPNLNVPGLPGSISTGENSQGSIRPPFFMPPTHGGAMPVPPQFVHPPPHMMQRNRASLAPPMFYQDMPPPGFGTFPYLPSPSVALQQTSNNRNTSPDLWIETSSSDGKLYYYHSKTRETSWTKPTSARVMTQAEFESLAASQNVNMNLIGKTGENSTSGEPNPSFVGTSSSVVKSDDLLEQQPSANPIVTTKSSQQSTEKGGNPMTSNQPDLENLDMDSDYLSGSPPLWTLTHQQDGSPDAGGSDLNQGSVENKDDSSVVPTSAATAVTNVAESNEEINGSSAKSHSSFQYPHQQQQQPPHQHHFNIPYMDKNLERMALEWSEHINEYGRVYYYNSRSMESTWDIPQVLKDYRERQMYVMISGHKHGNPDNQQPEVCQSEVEAQILSAEEEQKAKADAKAAEEEEKKKKKLQEASKPIFNRAVPATPWCMVWTKDGKIFFHNPSTSVSLWECPLELRGRTDVEKWLTEDPPTQESIKIEATKKPEEPATKKLKLNDSSSQPQFNPTPFFPGHLPSFPPSFPSNFPPGFPVPAHSGVFNPAHMEQEQHHNFFDPNFIHPSPGKQNTKASKEDQGADKSSNEDKLQKFMELLAEKEVSAFSTWEKELPKLVFDPRYLLLPAKDRRTAFEQYLRTRCDQERKEKLEKMKLKKEEFKKLLQDANMSGRWSFLEFCSKFSRDERFKSVEKMKEREVLFNEFIVELRKKEKSDSKSALDQAKRDFNHMLRDKVPTNLLMPGNYWSDARTYLQTDSRYRIVLDHPSHCEQWYKELCKSIHNNGGGSDEGEYLDDQEVDEVKKKEKERHDRVQASLREREKVVQESLYASLMERDKERKSHMREESIQHFKALMADMVRSADVSWRETRHNLKKDHRWGLAKYLDKSEKEELFEEHISHLSKKNKMAFHKLLDETLAGSLSATWKEIRKQIRDDPRCTRFSSHEKKREKEFDEYIVQRRLKAKQEFRDLLRETRLINHRSAELASDSGQHLKDIIVILQKDKRYLILDSMPEERMDILTGYIEEVAKRAPSPPPTASDPRSRAPLR